MDARVWKMVMVLGTVLVFTLISVSPVVAEATSGDGPFDAMAPTEEWQTLDSGQYRWYVFHFDRVEDEMNHPIEIKMVAEPYNSALLTIRNQDQVDEWVREGEHLHFGCTTMVNEDADVNGKPDYQQWAGALTASGDYYLVVEHARDVSEQANYQFTINGHDITFPTLEAVEAEPVASLEPEPVAMADEGTMDENLTTETFALTIEPAAAAAELMGTGPDFAMAPTGAWTELKAGEYHWYKINYDYDDDWTEPMTIELYSDPLDAAVLTVRNGHQAELWRQDGTHEHFGCCVRPEVTSQVESDDEDDEEGLMIDETEKLAEAIWSAHMTESGEYYLVVEHAKNSTEPTFYRFDIAGQGVGF